MKRKHLTVKSAASVALAYLLSLTAMMLIAAIILSNTLFSAGYHIDRIDRSGFPELALREIQEIYVSYGNASGIPESVMRETVTLSQVEDAAKSNIRSLFGTGSPHDLQAYTDELRDALVTYAQNAGITDQAQLYGLRALADVCAQAFSRHTDSELYRFIAQTVLPYGRYLDFAILGLAAVLALLALVLILLNRNIAKITRYGVYTSGAVSLLCLSVPAAAGAFGLSRLNISPESYNRLFSSVADGFFTRFLWVLIPAAALLLACVAIKIIQFRKIRGTKKDPDPKPREKIKKGEESKRGLWSKMADNINQKLQDITPAESLETAPVQAEDASPHAEAAAEPKIASAQTEEIIVRLASENAVPAQDGFSVVMILRAFANRKFMVLAVTMLAFMIGIVAAGGYFIVTRDGGSARAVLSFNYRGAERGLNPLGRPLDVTMLKSPYVLHGALERLNLYDRGLTTEAVRERIGIEGMIPQDAIDRMAVIQTIAEREPGRLEELLDIEHFPTQFIVTLNRSGELRALSTRELSVLLDGILESYRAYFFDEYSDCQAFVDVITGDFDIGEYDYPEAIRILNNQLSNIISYARIRQDSAPEFRSPATQMTFGDIVANLELVRSVDVARVSALVSTARLSRDPERLALTYEYSIRRMTMDRNVALANAEAAAEAARNYQRETLVVMGTLGEHTTVTQGSDVYDNLMNRAISEGERARQLEEEIGFHQELLEEIQEDGPAAGRRVRPEDIAFVEAALPELQASLHRWAGIANDTAEDFFMLEEFRDAARVTVPAQFTGPFRAALNNLLLIVAGVTLAGFFLAVLAAVWRKAFPKGVKNA